MCGWSLMYSLVLLEAEQLHCVVRKVNVGLCRANDFHCARQRKIAYFSIDINEVFLCISRTIKKRYQ